MSDPLDIFQQVFCLSVKVCSAATDTGTAAQLQATLATNLQTFISTPAFAGSDTWTMPWGPVVWQSPYSTFVDQAAAVCWNQTQNTYVVAVAATNPRSPFDVFMEDLAVLPAYMVDNPQAGGGMLSYGNSVALQVLLAMQSNGQTLGAFLAAQATANGSTNDVVFCGHSLAGGLAPLLAYALYPKGTAGSGWSNVYTFPTAGPTTADSAFQASYQAAYKPVAVGTGYQRWNANLFNGRDMVPHAWSTCADSVGPNLNDITASIISQDFGMYFTGADTAVEVKALRTMAIGLATGASGVPYVPVNNYQLFKADQQGGRITTNTALAAEIEYQHVTAYWDEFGVSALFSTTDQASIKPPLLPLVRAVAGAAALSAVAAE